MPIFWITGPHASLMARNLNKNDQKCYGRKMITKEFLKYSLYFSYIFFSLGILSCNTDSNPLAGIIQIRVTGVPNAHPCENNLYAVTFDDFNNRDGENQISLEDSGDGNWIGELNVGQGAIDVLVYVYCDSSTGDDTYDNDPPGGVAAGGGGGITPVNYTNTATFNACDRDIDEKIPSSYSYFSSYYATGTYHEYYGTTSPGWYGTYPSSWYSNPYVMTEENDAAQAGDIFTSFVANAGAGAIIPLAELEDLGMGPHSGVEGGTLSQWCNCILADDHHFTYNMTRIFSTSVYYTTTTSSGTYFAISKIYYHLTNVWSNIGFFTDTMRTSDNNSGQCILP